MIIIHPKASEMEISFAAGAGEACKKALHLTSSGHVGLREGELTIDEGTLVHVTREQGDYYYGTIKGKKVSGWYPKRISDLKKKAVKGKKKEAEDLSNKLAHRPNEKMLLARGLIKPTKSIPIFGVPLGQIMYTSYTEFEVPDVYLDCEKYLREKNCLGLEGIFRISGTASEMQSLRQSYDTGVTPDLSSISNSHSVSGLMKSFFRELPEPLFTFRAYDHFINSTLIQDTQERILYTKDMFKHLPPHVTKLLQLLLKLLSDVRSLESVNKMSAENLGIVFGPTLLRPKVESEAMFLHTDKQRDVVAFLLIHFKELFGDLATYKARFRALSMAPPMNGQVPIPREARSSAGPPKPTFLAPPS